MFRLIGTSCHSDTSLFCDDSNCILKEFVCDKYKNETASVVDCIDGTDETEATCNVNCNSSMTFLCDTGRCIDVVQVCDGMSDCGRAPSDDEANCQGI